MTKKELLPPTFPYPHLSPTNPPQPRKKYSVHSVVQIKHLGVLLDCPFSLTFHTQCINNSQLSYLQIHPFYHLLLQSWSVPPSLLSCTTARTFLLAPLLPLSSILFCFHCHPFSTGSLLICNSGHISPQNPPNGVPFTQNQILIQTACYDPQGLMQWGPDCLSSFMSPHILDAIGPCHTSLFCPSPFVPLCAFCSEQFSFHLFPSRKFR